MRVLDLGDSAFTVEFGATIDPALQAQVAALDAAIAAARDTPALAGLIETVPTFRSLTVRYDPLATTRASLEAAVRALAAGPPPDTAPPARQWTLPACYGGAFGPDLAAIADAAGLTPDETIALHTGADYVVYMLGFLPGFPFMGDVAPSLQRPRRAEPRLRVPAGSVAIANGLTAIYPWQSPGGWHLIGRCPVPLFDPRRDAPALLAAGDRVRFTAVAPDAFAALAEEVATGRHDPQRWCASP